MVIMTKDKKFFKGQLLIRNNGNEVEFLHDDGGNIVPILISHGDNTDWVAREDVKPSNKFTFAQVIQGLLEGYFEKGTEFRVNGRSVFVDCGWKGDLGLVDDLGGGFRRMEIGANLIHATWELPEEPIIVLFVSLFMAKIGVFSIHPTLTIMNIALFSQKNTRR